MTPELQLKKPPLLWGTLGFLLAGPFNPLIIIFALFVQPRTGGAGGGIAYPALDGTQNPVEAFGLAIVLSLCASLAMTFVLWRVRKGTFSDGEVRGNL